MRRYMLGIASLGFVLALASCGDRQGSPVDAAAETLGVADLNSIEYTGTGTWGQFGQPPTPATGAWPVFDVKSFTAVINYETPAARIQMTRIQQVDPARPRPPFVEQRPDQHVSGTSAWNLAPAPGGGAAVAQPQPAAVAERTMEIWATPHGFLKQAIANKAQATAADGGSEVSFTLDGKYRYVGHINAQNQVTKVQSWIPDAVLGDTPVEFAYSDYKDFGGVTFPAKIVRTQGGQMVWNLTVTGVKANPGLDLPVPEAVKSFTPPPMVVNVETLADGVYYFTGTNAHTVAIDQGDHIVAVEAPTSEARSLAVIAKIKETIPNKPIRFIVNSHVHFDHSSGLRTYVDEGATVVTHALNQPYYEKAWAAPRTLMPDRLSESTKAATFLAVTDKHVLEGTRPIEIHNIAGNPHNDGFLMVYLPNEKILIEGDAYTPQANRDAPAPAVPSPFSLNLKRNIDRLGLQVDTIASLHGRTATVAEFHRDIGMAAAP